MMCVRHLPKMSDLHMIRCHLMGALQPRTDSHITGGASWSHLELKVVVQCQRCCLDLDGTEWIVKVGVMLTPPHPRRVLSTVLQSNLCLVPWEPADISADQ